jgi:hypothetical protein
MGWPGWVRSGSGSPTIALLLFSAISARAAGGQSTAVAVYCCNG